MLNTFQLPNNNGTLVVIGVVEVTPYLLIVFGNKGMTEHHWTYTEENHDKYQCSLQCKNQTKVYFDNYLCCNQKSKVKLSNFC